MWVSLLLELVSFAFKNGIERSYGGRVNIIGWCKFIGGGYVSW
jgi:hypothetical protein